MGRGAAAGACLVAAALALAGCAGTTVGAHAAPAGRITVLGTGRVAVPSSGASFSVGVQQHAQTAAAALAATNRATNALIAALERHGVAAKDLTTEQLTLNPRYVYANGQPPRLAGFQAGDTLRVKVADAAHAGPLIDAAVSAGATNVQAIAFGAPHGAGLQAKALAAAVADARQRAAAVATAAHQSLGPVLSVTMQAVTGTPRPVFFAAAATASPSSTPVESGSQQVRADVRVTFATVG